MVEDLLRMLSQGQVRLGLRGEGLSCVVTREDTTQG